LMLDTFFPLPLALFSFPSLPSSSYSFIIINENKFKVKEYKIQQGFFLKFHRNHFPARNLLKKISNNFEEKGTEK